MITPQAIYAVFNTSNKVCTCNQKSTTLSFLLPEKNKLKFIIILILIFVIHLYFQRNKEFFDYETKRKTFGFNKVQLHHLCELFHTHMSKNGKQFIEVKPK